MEQQHNPPAARSKNRGWQSLGLALLIWGCTEAPLLKSNTGNQGELIVVVPDGPSPAADSLLGALTAVFPALPAPEPLLKIVTVKQSGFNDLFATHRNIVRITLDSCSALDVRIRRDVNARQQVLVDVCLPSQKLLSPSEVAECRQLLWYFHKAEVDRLISRNRDFPGTEAQEAAMTTLGLSLNAQIDMQVAKQTENSIWLRLDRQKPIGGYQHDIKQGVVIARRYFTDTTQFADTALLAWINDEIAKHVSGPSTSRMAISEKVMLPSLNTVVFNQQSAKEVRGLWRMDGAEGVFMGGPFYALVFASSQYQYLAYGYVYGPQFNKAVFVREMEAVIKSIAPLAKS